MGTPATRATRARRDLRRGLHTHTVRSWARTELAVTVGDPSGQVLQAFQVSHELHRLYTHARDVAHPLHRIPVRCADGQAPELHRHVRTLDTWRGELLAYWSTCGRRAVSNGPTEATNCLIKKVSGHGFRNFQNYRLRLLLNVGLDWRNLSRQVASATRSEDANHACWRRACFARSNDQPTVAGAESISTRSCRALPVSRRRP